LRTFETVPCQATAICVHVTEWEIDLQGLRGLLL